MKECEYECLLNIETDGEQKGFHHSFHYHRYEPTPYIGLKQLFDSFQLVPGDVLVDYGSGKGRLAFFVHHTYGVQTKGIEMNEDFYAAAQENKSSYFHKFGGDEKMVQFENCLAERYPVKKEDTVFYFFNPFSLQIFMRVIDQILQSVEEHYRDISIVLYYSSDDYQYFMENHSLFQLKKEIAITGMYERNEYERFLVYGLRY
ncbi:SAM-dependent methyltransferase [Bacillus sp. 1P06AnD]|uniref:SAM-dependent methyltransferase n=1 Tax=Bacillus sp. 1P06AnD TaxID=3132208 RepID=UPI0039A1FF5A